MRLTEIIAELRQRKGNGSWKRIAERSGVDYTTIARIARGDMPNPGVLTCERIAASLVVEQSSTASPGPAGAEAESSNAA